MLNRLSLFIRLFCNHVCFVGLILNPSRAGEDAGTFPELPVHTSFTPPQQPAEIRRAQMVMAVADIEGFKAWLLLRMSRLPELRESD
jgi:hypothetical protein